MIARLRWCAVWGWACGLSPVSSGSGTGSFCPWRWVRRLWRLAVRFTTSNQINLSYRIYLLLNAIVEKVCSSERANQQWHRHYPWHYFSMPKTGQLRGCNCSWRSSSSVSGAADGAAPCQLASISRERAASPTPFSMAFNLLIVRNFQPIIISKKIERLLLNI